MSTLIKSSTTVDFVCHMVTIDFLFLQSSLLGKESSRNVVHHQLQGIRHQRLANPLFMQPLFGIFQSFCISGGFWFTVRHSEKEVVEIKDSTYSWSNNLLIFCAFDVLDGTVDDYIWW